jgi:oligoribonuclease
MAETDLLVWMDMEMTGLDPDTCRIIELATLLTNSALEVVAEGPELVIHQPEPVLGAMDAWNVSHHTASGLLERVRASTTTEAEAEAATMDFLRAHVPARSAPLAGNSVHQDRRFLRRYMPAIEAHLHYRIVDVSTVKELTKRWYPRDYGAAPSKQSSHRALDDIRESIAELRYYRDTIFKPR